MMKRKLKCIMLIDDDEDDNFFHELVTREAGISETVHIAESAFEALDYIKSSTELPELIFLDINMPKMNGWEFIEEYAKLKQLQDRGTRIFMLSTSLNPHDIEKSRKMSCITGFKTKPLNVEMLNEIYQMCF